MWLCTPTLLEMWQLHMWKNAFLFSLFVSAFNLSENCTFCYFFPQWLFLSIKYSQIPTLLFLYFHTRKYFCWNFTFNYAQCDLIASSEVVTLMISHISCMPHIAFGLVEASYVSNHSKNFVDLIGHCLAWICHIMRSINTYVIPFL